MPPQKGKSQKSKKGNKNAKKPNIVEYDPNKKARGHPPMSIQGRPTVSEIQERKYLNTAFKSQHPSYPIAAIRELQDPLENTQDLLPHKKRAHHYPLPPPVKTNPFREAQLHNEYDDPTSLSRSNRSSQYDKTERDILFEEGMVTPPSTPSNASPTTPDILSAIKSLDTPTYIPPPSSYPIDEDISMGFDPYESLPPTPTKPKKTTSNKKNPKKSVKKGGKKQCKNCKKYYTCKHNCCKRKTRKCNKRNTKKRRKY